MDDKIQPLFFNNGFWQQTRSQEIKITEKEIVEMKGKKGFDWLDLIGLTGILFILGCLMLTVYLVRWNNSNRQQYGLPCHAWSDNQKCLRTYEEGGKIWWNGYTFWRGGGQLAYHVTVVDFYWYASMSGGTLTVKLPEDMPEVAKLWTYEARSSSVSYPCDGIAKLFLSKAFTDSASDLFYDFPEKGFIEEFTGDDVRLFIEVIEVKEGEIFNASPLAIDWMYEQIRGPATITRIAVDKLKLGDVDSRPRFLKIPKPTPTPIPTPKWQTKT